MDTYEFDKIIKKENYTKSNLVYDTNHNFYRYYRNRKKFINFSFKLKHSFLNKFFDDLDYLYPQKRYKREETKCK